MRWFILATLAACNLAPKPTDTDTGDSGDGGDDTGTPAGDSVIYQVRTGEIAVGEVVTIEGAIVTAPKTFDEEAFFIQDASGAPWTGIQVWSYNGVSDIYVEQGDEVTVTGTVSEYFGLMQIAIDGPEDVVETGTATVPAPADLGDGAAVTDWEPYESMLVALSDQTVEGTDDYGTGLLSAGVWLDDTIYRVDFSCGDHFDGLTGVLSYSFEKWGVNPRSDADAVGHTVGTPVLTTVAAIQGGETCGPVQLEGVIATTDAWDDEGSSYLFVQDAGGGEQSGVQVFIEGDSTDLVVGDSVSLIGEATEYYGMTQVKVTDPGSVTVGDPADAVSYVLTAAPSDWEPWEGVLVTLDAVTITDDADEYGQYPTSYGLLIDDELYDPTLDAGDEFVSITGVIAWSYSEWKLWPRSAADFVD